MGQFKPMVKMETTEPSVILKLKKGGHVGMNRGGEYGFANMRAKGMNTMPDDRYSAPAAAPAPSSIADDRVVLSVGGTEITKKAFELILGSVTEEARAAGDPKKAVATNISGLLQVAQEARAAKFDQDRPRQLVE